MLIFRLYTLITYILRLNHRFCFIIILFQYLFNMTKRKAKISDGHSKRMNNSQGDDNEQVMNDNNYDH
jgi:hypothetical protein